jgi:VWFA-related protein
MDTAINRVTRANQLRRRRGVSSGHSRVDAGVESDDRHRHHRPKASGRAADIRDAATISPNQDTMRAIAELTGGRVYLNTNAIGESIRRAIDDSRVSYVLGYRSSRPDNDNKFRNITVKVSRGGVELRHRKGYLALTAPTRDSKERLKALERVM